MASIITQDLRKLRAGEEDVVRLLEKGLPDDWDIACTLAIPDGSDSREVDVLALGPRGIYVIEVKHRGGYLELNSGALTRSGRYLENPYYQVDGASKVVAGYLKNKCPELAQLGGKPVHAHLVFSRHDVRLVRVEDEIQHQVSTLDELPQDLLSRDAQSRLDLVSCRSRLRNVLSVAQLRDAVPGTILSYSVGDQLSTSSSIRSFEATHADGTEYVIRLLRPKNTLDKSYAVRERDGLLREYESLRQLSALDVCPPVHSYQELEDGDYLVPIQAIEGRSLAQEITDGVEPDGDRVTEVVAAAFRALAIVHEAQPTVVHRSITPERVVITPSGSVKFTDFQIAHIDERTGLTTVLTEIDPDDEQHRRWRAPEARNDLTYATTYSDVWSLATSLRAWVIGSTKSKHLRKDTLPGEVRVRLSDAAEQFADLLKAARAATGRPTAREIADHWGPTEATSSATPGETSTVAAPAKPLCHQSLEPGDIILDRYELLATLGTGSTAVTYLVRDREVDETVVLKSFDFERVPESLALEEFRKAKGLVHERIATVREYHRPEHPFHLVMDHAPGRELFDQRERFRGDAERVSRVADGLLEALAYIHDKGYLHRDISPRNIIVSDDDPRDLKVIDFGLAALKSEASPRSMGTFAYVAPEIVQGGEWIPASDVYSAGVVLFQLLTGDWPFAMAGAPVHDELREPPAEFGDEAARLGKLLLTAVQPDPAARFPDAGEFLAALHEHLEAEPTPTQSPDQEPHQDREQAAEPASASWLKGLSSIADADPIQGSEPTQTSAPTPLYIAQTPSMPSLEGTRQPALSLRTPQRDASLRVTWVADTPSAPQGNIALGVGRIRKYSLGLDGTVRGVLATSGRERTVYARVPGAFTTMVNEAKRAGGQGHGGSLVIDHDGQVLAGTAQGILLAGRVEGFLEFEDGSRVLTPIPPDHLSPGDLWEGLGVGLRYKLNASTSDIAYESTSGGWVWLSGEIGEQEATRVAGALGAVKRGGGRFYVNEAGAAFGPLQMGGEWREAYLGAINPALWFSSASR